MADTRSATAGILLGGAPRTFNIVGATTNYSNQGGVAGGCAIPGFVAGKPQVQAVAINVVAVDPSGDGFLTAWPTGQTTAGRGNCNAWTSSAAGSNGTRAYLSTDWMSASTVPISPWIAEVQSCDTASRVWCVEN